MPNDSKVAEFTRRHVPSLWALELLLALWRDPARRWSPFDLVTELRASLNLVSKNLVWFEHRGLVAREKGGWCAAAAPPEVAEMVAGLAELYRQRPLHVMKLIAATSLSHEIDFSEAFDSKAED